MKGRLYTFEYEEIHMSNESSKGWIRRGKVTQFSELKSPLQFVVDLHKDWNLFKGEGTVKIVLLFASEIIDTAREDELDLKYLEDHCFEIFTEVRP